jgi:uncharacterized protein YlzI (FlbEa/FlbD family)
MDPLILLRRLGGPVFALNPDLIERAEATPDTVVTLIGGNKHVVSESLEELISLIREHRARIIAASELMTRGGADLQSCLTGDHSERSAVAAVAMPQRTSAVIPFRTKDS